MGRFVITNMIAWDEFLHENNEKVGFICNGYDREDSVSARTYGKLNIDSFNFLKMDNDYIASCGTLIYKNAIGKQALSLLLENVSVGNFHVVRKELAGCFVVIYKHEDNLFVFTDESAVYSVYYYSGSGFLISNTFFHVELCAKQPINTTVAIEYMFNGMIIGNETPFLNIKRLGGDECIVYNFTEKYLGVKKIQINNYEYNFNSFEQKLQTLVTLIRKHTRYKKLFSGRHVLFGTGGWIADCFCPVTWQKKFGRVL